MPVSRISCSTFISTNSGASWWIDEYLRDRNEGEGKEGKKRERNEREEEEDRGKRRETRGDMGDREKRREVRRRTVVNVELSSHNDC